MNQQCYSDDLIHYYVIKKQNLPNGWKNGYENCCIVVYC